MAKLNFCPTYKYLGILLNGAMTFKEEIEKFKEKIKVKVKKKTVLFIPERCPAPYIRALAFKAYILPHFAYRVCSFALAPKKFLILS